MFRITNLLLCLPFYWNIAQPEGVMENEMVIASKLPIGENAAVQTSYVHSMEDDMQA